MTESAPRPFFRWKIPTEWLLVTGFFSYFTAWLYRDIIFSLSEKVLAGQQCAGYFSWLFWWRLHALQTGASPFYSHLIMFPVGTQVFPNAPLTEVVAVFITWMTNSRVAVNLVLLSSYVLTGVSCYALLRFLTKSPLPSLCGAFTYAFSEYMLTQHLHGQLMETSLYFNPLLAMAYLKFRSKHSLENSVWVGLSFLGVLLSGTYMAFSFGAIFLLGALAYEIFLGHFRWLSRTAATRLTISLAVPTLIAVVCFWPLIKFSGQLKGGEFFYPHLLSSYFTPPRLERTSAVLPEMSMGYLGIGTLFFIAYGLWHKLHIDQTYRFFLCVFVVALVFSLGPWLTISEHLQTIIPLPYLIFQKLPAFSNFRVPGRIMLTVTLASAVLCAYGLRQLLANQPRHVKLLTVIVFIAFTTFEFDVPFNIQRHARSKPPVLYDIIKNDPEPAAVLELPQPYAPTDLLVRAQLFMLYEVYHQHPIVLGYQSRYLADRLNFTDKTPVVFELTHPAAFLQLETDPAFKEAAHWIEKNGADMLKSNRIKYVVLHENLPAYSPAVANALARWIEKILGAPIATDPSGVKLYQTR